MQHDENTTSEAMVKEANKLKKKYETVEEEDKNENEEAWDDVSGAALDPKEVR